jgi:hypothetical protein
MTLRAPAVAIALLAACHHGATPAAGPTCVQVADHVLSLLDAKNERAHPIRDVFFKRCTADAWPLEARACIVDESSVHGGRHCKDRLGPARDALERDLTEIDAPKLPPECERYTRSYEDSQRCDKLSTRVKQRIAAQYKDLSTRIGKGERGAIIETCTARATDIDQEMTQNGCDSNAP